MISGGLVDRLDALYEKINTAQTTVIFLTLLSAYTEKLFADPEIRRQLDESIEQASQSDKPSFDEIMSDSQIFMDRLLADSELPNIRRTIQLKIISLSEKSRTTLLSLDDGILSDTDELLSQLEIALCDFTLQLAERNACEKWDAYMQYFQDPKPSDAQDYPEIFIGVLSIVQYRKASQLDNDSENNKFEEAYRELSKYYNLIVAKDVAPASYCDELYIQGYRLAKYDDKPINEADVFLTDIMFDTQVLAFSSKTLLSALRTLHTHVNISQQGIVSVPIQKLGLGEFSIVNENQLYKNGRLLDLHSPQLLSLMVAFAKAKRYELSYDKIVEAIDMNRETSYDPKTIQSRISSLNKELGKAESGKNHIRKVSGSKNTYRFFL